jgi:hypothetical protein
MHNHHPSECFVFGEKLRELVTIPHNPCLHPFRHLGEQIRGAYMPSWVLLSMTAVEERVRERKTKL